MSALATPSQPTLFQPVGAPATGAAGGVAPGVLLNGIYQVKRFLARGGMGEVYEGVNVNTDERVAIKVMLPELAANPKIQALFRKEARILTELAHPALVRYRVLAQEPQLGFYYIVTEFIDGRSLAEMLGELKPTATEIAGLMRRLAEGLGAAHALGAVHRDMAPDNVLLPGGRLADAKIIDFGIAREADSGQQTVIGDSFAGKLGFVAPEQFGDFDRQLGPWTDVYSLGLVGLALAAGEAPDMGKTLVEAVDYRRRGVDLSPLPAELKPVFEKMLAPDPADRWRSMAEVIEAFDAAARNAAPRAPQAASPAPGSETPKVKAPPSPTILLASGDPPPMAEESKRSQRGLILAGAGAVAALAAGLGLAMALGGGQKASLPKPAEAVAVPAAPAAVAETAPPPVQTLPAPAPQAATPQPAPAAIEAPRPAAPAPVKIAKAALPPAAPLQAKPKARPAPALTPMEAYARSKAAPEPLPLTVAAGVPAQSAAPARAEGKGEAAAPSAAAGVEACWRANGGGWTYLGYASQTQCAAQAFENHCETVHGRWGKQPLRRYNGSIETKGNGAFARWRRVAPSTCPAG